MAVVALDIGGANLKMADSEGSAWSEPFAVWRAPDALSRVIGRCLRRVSSVERLLITMTAELCDCYVSKSEGVRAVLDAVVVAAEAAGVRPDAILVWSTTESWVSVEQARAGPLQVAAANWLATARWLAQRVAPQHALLVDVGSTTSDVILVGDGRVQTLGRDDTSRLRSRELVYVGVRRTPVPMLVEAVPWQQAMLPVARELFATTGDVFLLRGDLAEEPTRTDTADGRPFTKPAARRRLARVVCADAGPESDVLIERVASYVADRVEELVASAVAAQLRRSGGRVGRVVVAGEGEFLARRAVARGGWSGLIESLSGLVGREASMAAAAWAMVQLHGRSRDAARGG